MLVKSGTGTLTLSAPNNYTGGTVLSNGVLVLGSNAANNDGLGGSGLGPTNSPVTFRGGTLELFGFTGSEGANYNTLYNPLIVPAGEIGELRMFQRGPANSGGNAGLQSSLTGAGNLNLIVNYVRDDLSGDWSAFTGHINVLARDGGDEMRVNNNFGYANSTITLNDGVSLCRSFTADTVNDLGALHGTGLSILGQGNSAGARTTWRVGWLNTDAEFAGTIVDDSGGTHIVKVGTGTWTLSGFNTHTGPTIISNGVLAVTGSLSSTNIIVGSGAFLDVSLLSSLSVAFGQTLGGNGTVWGSVDTFGGGTIAPGLSVGTLTVTNSVSLGGEAVMEVSRSGGVLTNDKLVAPGITLGGTLRVESL
jgi:autotransporter-associated beta strand protein